MAEGLALPAWRCGSVEEFGERLGHALNLDVPSLIVLAIDYVARRGDSRGVGG